MIVPVSVVVLAKNEQSNVGRALASVRWACEVILVDSGSIDETLNIARTFSNCRIMQTSWQGYTRTKQIGVDAAQNDWILWLDADEEVTSELAASIAGFFQSQGIHEPAAAKLRRLTYIRQKAIYHSGWYPGWTLRLFHRHRCSLVDRPVHEYVELNQSHRQSRIASLNGDLKHYSYPTFESYFKKSVQYATLAAQDLQERGHSFQFWRLLVHPSAAIFRQYFLKLGFLDGVEGLIIAIGSAYGRFIKYALLYEKSS